MVGRTLLILSVLLIMTSATDEETINYCRPDKGIKTAITTGEMKAKKSSKKEPSRESQKVEYNKDGQAVYIFKSKDGSEYIRRYKDGKLQFIIYTYKDIPSFYLEGQKDSLLANAETVSDTSIVLSHNESGRPIKMQLSDGTVSVSEYVGCDEEMITTFSANGDTLQQVRLVMRNGVLVENIWTPFYPIKSTVTSIYYDYKFNRKGHWVKRRYKISSGEVTEKRKLTYY
jgi:hypothetical protein